MLDEHLFRREAGRMVAALTRVFGIHNLALAEDVVQDALCRALEVWKFEGPPENPAAWLMATAKHRALDVLRRERTARTFAPELGRLLESEWTVSVLVDELFEPKMLKDDLLRMIFSCSLPKLKEEAQVALVLNVLCGFGVSEIASAFLSTPAAIEKRIHRAKAVLRRSKRLFNLDAPADVAVRLPAVHRALYLLFNEGYHGASAQTAIRAELCQEAMRLTALLLERADTATPGSHALLALMCLHAARLPARLDEAGELSPLLEQDRERWDSRLVSEGLNLLDLSARGPEVTPFHLEAAIAAFHARAPRGEDTDWAQIVLLYDRLLELAPSPVVALNRAIAIAQLRGPAAGLAELGAIADVERLSGYPFYAAALGELELRLGHPQAALGHFQAAVALARNPMEQRFLERRLSACGSPG